MKTTNAAKEAAFVVLEAEFALLCGVRHPILDIEFVCDGGKYSELFR
jgi:hypothetical protein